MYKTRTTYTIQYTTRYTIQQALSLLQVPRDQPPKLFAGPTSVTSGSPHKNYAKAEHTKKNNSLLGSPNVTSIRPTICWGFDYSFRLFVQISSVFCLPSSIFHLPSTNIQIKSNKDPTIGNALQTTTTVKTHTKSNLFK